MLERTKKVEVIMFCISVISFVLMILEFAAGGGELLSDGFMNNPVNAILMFVFAVMFILSLLIGIGFNGIRKDVEDELRYLYSRETKDKQI